MKKKFKLLSVVTALFIGATMTLTACGKDSVEEHDHVWNNGEVTTEATCHSEGVKTYTCTFDGCGQTKTEPVAMKAHSWNNGEVTEEPTCSKEGVKTFTCTVDGCGNTKKEPIDKTEHQWDDGKISKMPNFYTKGEKKYTCLDCGTEKTESVAAHADFAGQYVTSVNEKSNWQYGYTQSFNAETNEAEFISIAGPTDGAWKADGVEISKGYVYSAKYAMIAYTFNEEVPEYIQAEALISFSGDESATVLKAYVLVTDGNGEVKGRDALNPEGKKDWSYQTEEAIDIAQGYTFWLVFENAGTGKAGGSLTITLTASCVHVWSNTGSVKKAASCTEEGIMEYPCINCDAKKSETISKVPHEYEEEVTKEPTETEDGIKTYTCKVCGDSYTEDIPKLGSSEFNGANFAEDFSTEGNNGWLYGYATNYNWDTNEFVFNALTPDGDGWKGDGMEVKKDWLLTEKGDVAVGYKMPANAPELYVNVSFTGTKADETRIASRIVVIGADGHAKFTKISDEGAQQASWEINCQVDVSVGDTIYVILFRKSDAWAQGQLQVVLSEEATEQPEPDIENKIADFAEDFATDGENNWLYGHATGYDWDNNEFTFNNLNPDGDAWKGSGMEVKKDWILVEGGDVAVGYKVPTGYGKLSVKVSFTGTSADETRIASRIVIIGADGHAKFVKISDDGEQQASWEINCQVDVSVGDTIYVILFRKSDAWAQGKLQVVIGGESTGQPEPPKPEKETVANFKDDFYRDLGNENSWKYGYSDYSFDGGESFEFHQFGNYVEEGAYAWKSDKEGSAQIKDDWIDVGWGECSNATIAYHAEKAMTFELSLHFNGGMPNTRVIVRIGIKDKDGNLKGVPEGIWNGAENREWTLNKEFTLEAGDTIYIIFFDEHKELPEGWANGNVEITLTAEKGQTEQPEPEEETIADFNEDFYKDLADKNSWMYGYSDYSFDGGESFEFHQFENYVEDSAYAWKSDKEGSAQIKEDWIDVGWGECGNATIAYCADKAVTFNLKLHFTGGMPNTRVIVRIGIKDKDGNLKGEPTGYWDGANGKEWSIDVQFTLEQGDTLYIIFFDEHKELPEGWANGNVEITLTASKTED